MKQHKKGLAIWLAVVALLFIAALLAGSPGQLITVNSGVIFALLVTAVLLIAAALIRIFAIPRFKLRPGKLQLALEEAVGLFDGVAKGSSPHQNRSIGARIISAGAAVFVWARNGIRQHKKGLLVWLTAVAVLLIAALLAGSPGRSETVQEAMRDAVLHDSGRISLFGLKTVTPGMISAFLVTAILLIAAALIRIFAIPRFKFQPGTLQLVLEEAVGLFDGMAKGSSPHRNRFLRAYIFSAGAFIFVGTLFELLGLQAITVHGHPITLPAPLSDVNAAIGLGVLSYLVIVSGAVAEHGPKGVLKALKEFSLPISMSFRLFGALLSGLLVTELVYYFVNLSFVLPVVVGVLFTLLHALIQTYVLTMLVALYYGEVSEPGGPSDRRDGRSAKPNDVPRPQSFGETE